ncbi:hypothetical protein JXO52_16100 [bacterium]|nr:hypothetical protein [bacterium]
MVAMSNKSSNLYLGVLLTSASTILFEVALTKVFSVTMWYHFGYFTLSLALFGMGAGGLGAYFRQHYLNRRFPAILKQLTMLQAASFVVCIIFVLSVPTMDLLNFTGIVRLTSIFIFCALPFFLAGVIISTAIQHNVNNVSRIYFSDLIGAALGCLLFYVAITFLSGPGVVLFACILAIGASIAFVERNKKNAIRTRIFILIITAATLFTVDSYTNIFTVRYTKTYKERKDILFEKWSPLARITVYPKVFWRENAESPFGWGMSSKYKSDEKRDQLWVEQDANAGTPITRYSGNKEELDYLKYDVTTFAYHLFPKIEDVFIIGAGGGRDILSALAFDVKQIKSCDINPITIHLVKDTYREFCGDIYHLPNVDVEVAEGRSYLRRQKNDYDIIQISLIDSWVATLAGAFSLAENNLYTVEAFQDYFNHLDDDGMLSLTRFLFKPRNQTLRIAILAREALAEYGVTDPSKAIAVVGTKRGDGMATTLIGKKPFSQHQLEKIRTKADSIGFDVLYLPGMAGSDQDFYNALTADDLDEYIESSYYDFRPPTDNWPFFFQMLYFSNAFDIIFKNKEIVGQRFNYVAPLVLTNLMIISGLMVALFYFLPLSLSRKSKRLPSLFGLFFISIGLGFMLVEVYLIQKGSLYLGHPTFSLTAVLFSMLTAAGLGSFFSGRFKENQLRVELMRTGAVLFGLLILMGPAMKWVCTNTIELPLPLKFTIFIALVAVVAFFMGMMFPTGIRLLGPKQTDSVPWVWALNGGASVMGSIFAMSVAMMFGYLQMLYLGCLCYFLAVLAVYFVREKRQIT